MRHFSSLLEASRAPAFQYLFRAHRFLRALQVPAHFSSLGVLSRTFKVTPPYPGGGDMGAEGWGWIYDGAGAKEL